jgi:hypothetical protein
VNGRFADEGGAVAVIVALSLLVIMGLLTFVVDGGRLYVERSRAQNAADHAAIAAAWADCNPEVVEDPYDAGARAARSNGFETGVGLGGLPVAVTLNEVGDNQWGADVTVGVPPLIAPVLGVDELTAGARAVATCFPGEPSGSSPAVHAEGNGCLPEAFEWTDNLGIIRGDVQTNGDAKWNGNKNILYGNLRSNRDFVFSGSEHRVEGDGTYVRGYVGPSRVTWVPSADNPRQVPASPFSIDVGVTLADYQPGGKFRTSESGNFHSFTGDRNLDHLRASGLYNESTKQLVPGIYFTTGSWTILSDGTGPGTGLTGQVTFVSSSSEKRIEVGGRYADLKPYRTATHSAGIVAFSGVSKGCGDIGVLLRGDFSKFEGVVYAPNAKIELNDDDMTINGSLVGRVVTINTDRVAITAPSAGAAPGAPFVGLSQ